MKTNFLLVSIIVLLVIGIITQGVLSSGYIFEYYHEDVTGFGNMYRVVDTELGIVCYSRDKVMRSSALTCVQIR